MKYLIKDTENNKLYRPTLINTIVEGEEIGEDIKTINNDIRTLVIFFISILLSFLILHNK